MRTFAKFRPAALILILMCVAGEAGAQGASPSPASNVGGACPLTRFSDRAFRTAETDSTWQKLAPGMLGSCLLNRKNRWAIDAAWFQLADSGSRLFTTEDLKRLERQGVISDTTMFSIVSYRFVVKARSADEARAAGLKRRVHLPPVWVLKQLGVSPGR